MELIEEKVTCINTSFFHQIEICNKRGMWNWGKPLEKEAAGGNCISPWRKCWWGMGSSKQKIANHLFVLAGAENWGI